MIAKPVARSMGPFQKSSKARNRDRYFRGGWCALWGFEGCLKFGEFAARRLPTLTLARRQGERARFWQERQFVWRGLCCGRLEIERNEASLGVTGGEPEEGVSGWLLVVGDEVMRCRS